MRVVYTVHCAAGQGEGCMRVGTVEKGGVAAGCLGADSRSESTIIRACAVRCADDGWVQEVRWVVGG